MLRLLLLRLLLQWAVRLAVALTWSELLLFLTFRGVQGRAESIQLVRVLSRGWTRFLWLMVVWLRELGVVNDLFLRRCVASLTGLRCLVMTDR